ncbi:MAG: hypothetical protein H7843_10885 [Nitrospirota bacterium]
MCKLIPLRLRGKQVVIAGCVIVCTVLWVLSLFLFLHSNEILILSWDKIPIENFRHDTGYAWFTKFINSSFTPPSRAVLLENGLPLRRANAAADAVAYVGRGRYYISNDELLFSTSDNSDPTQNGRKYELLSASRINNNALRLIFFLSVLSSAILVVLLCYSEDLYLLNPLRTFVKDNKKAVDLTIACASVIITVVPFMITRLPYLLYYPVVLIRPDSYGYFDVAMQIVSGAWPDLSLRTPGYPMFIAAVLLVSKEILSVIIVQNLLSLLAALTFVYGIFISYRYMAPLAALGMAAFISSHAHMAGDCSLLSESLYVSATVFAFAFLTIALKRCSPLFFALSSLALGFVVYIRPAGLFVVAVFVPVIVWINGHSRRAMVAFVLPFLSMLLVLCCYNYIMLKSFALDNFSGEVFVVANSIFLEEDDKYPAALNAAIRKIRAVATNEERAFLNSIWDKKKYNDTISAIFAHAGSHGGIIGAISEALGNPPKKEMKKVLKTLVIDAMKKHPVEFTKKFFLFLLIYYDNARSDTDIYNSINGSYSSLYLTGQAEKEGGHAVARTLMRYISPLPLPYFTVETVKQGGQKAARAGEYVATWLQGFHLLIYTKLHRALFRGLFWPLAFAAAYVASAVLLVRSGWSNTGALLLFTMGSAVFVHAVGVALSTHPDLRYSYTLEFSYYLLPLLFPICYNKHT